MILPIDYNRAIIEAQNWLEHGQTSICWITGPSGSNKSQLLRTLVKTTPGAQIIDLTWASPDRCLQQALGVRTSFDLCNRMKDISFLILDGLDTIQYTDDTNKGKISDHRFLHLLLFTLAGRWPQLRVVVASRLAPSAELNSNAITLLRLKSNPSVALDIHSMDQSKQSVLKTLASSRYALNSSLLGYLSLQSSPTTPTNVQDILDEAQKANLVCRLDIGGEDWYQIQDYLRPQLIPAHEKQPIHKSIADKLLGTAIAPYLDRLSEKDPLLQDDILMRALQHRIEVGNMDEAVMIYWKRLGNYSRLERDNAIYLGAHACFLLNGRHSIMETNQAFKNAAGGWAVLNDWGLYGFIAGDMPLSKMASIWAYQAIPRSEDPIGFSLLASQIGQFMTITGTLEKALEWTKTAREHVVEAMRSGEGVPTKEVMSAYDQFFLQLIRIAVAFKNKIWVSQLLDELEEIHSRAVKKHNELSTHSILGMPEMRIKTREDLLEGRAAAFVEMLSGRPGEAIHILKKRLGVLLKYDLDSSTSIELQLMLLRALVAQGLYIEAKEEIPSIKASIENSDDTVARCELACVEANVFLCEGAYEAGLDVTEQYLLLAKIGDMILIHNELCDIRAKILIALGRTVEAKACIKAIKNMGPGPTPKPFKKRSLPKKESKKKGVERRIQLHEEALKVLEDYHNTGAPFALYFRKYGIGVSHGPLEFGPQLIENQLVALMPKGVNIITIQNQEDSIEYAGEEMFFDRTAPALLLHDQNWKEVVGALIPFADLIVSECYFLSEAVRFELQTAYETQCWDRTVLLLPPQKSIFRLIDSDPLIQMFPRCIWVDAFHTQSIDQFAQIEDLVTRMGEIAALPKKNRSQLVDRFARDHAFPINLLPLASHYEFLARWSAQWKQEDDRIVYYGFWKLFRANAIRAVSLLTGNQSFENKIHLSDNYQQMSVIMLYYEQEGDKIIFTGDLDFAEQCASSAYHLVKNVPDADFLMEAAEKQYRYVLKIREAIVSNPNRLINRPLYGPFPGRSIQI